MMISLKKLFKNWGVVQPAERLTVNVEVAGSSPAAPASLLYRRIKLTVRGCRTSRRQGFAVIHGR